MRAGEVTPGWGWSGGNVLLETVGWDVGGCSVFRASWAIANVRLHGLGQGRDGRRPYAMVARRPVEGGIGRECVSPGEWNLGADTTDAWRSCSRILNGPSMRTPDTRQTPLPSVYSKKSCDFKFSLEDVSLHPASAGTVNPAWPICPRKCLSAPSPP